MYEKIILPYAYDELEPYIDERTIRIHYLKHLEGYSKRLNRLTKGYERFFYGKTIEEVLSRPRRIPRKIRQDVINEGGGVANHNLYFSILSPNARKRPRGRLLNEINRTYGSVENLMKELTETTVKVFGSGYGWLVCDNRGKIGILATNNQDSPLSLGLNPLITIDVWEHAYYLKYENKRREYVKNIWNIISWEIVEKNYKLYYKENKKIKSLKSK